MAIYRLEAKTGSRKQGKSARAKVDYLGRAGKYRKGDGSNETRFIRSGNMPAWGLEGRTGSRAGRYWKAADRFERKNGLLCRELIVSIPVELSKNEQNELAGKFASEVADSEDGKLPYTFAVHEGKGHNPHFHLVLSERINDGLERTPETWFKRASVAGKDPAAGGARKARIGSHRKEWLMKTRIAWEKAANDALVAAGHDVRIDHRSNRDQGLDRVPQPKISSKIMAMEAKGIRTDVVDRILNDLDDAEIAKMSAINTLVAYRRRDCESGEERN